MSKAVEYKKCDRYICTLEYVTQNIDNINHSYNDEPAYIAITQYRYYYSYSVGGRCHRDDAPARIHRDDGFEWYCYGVPCAPKCQKL